MVKTKLMWICGVVVGVVLGLKLLGMLLWWGFVLLLCFALGLIAFAFVKKAVGSKREGDTP